MHMLGSCVTSTAVLTSPSQGSYRGIACRWACKLGVTAACAAVRRCSVDGGQLMQRLHSQILQSPRAPHGTRPFFQAHHQLQALLHTGHSCASHDIGRHQHPHDASKCCKRWHMTKSSNAQPRYDHASQDTPRANGFHSNSLALSGTLPL